MLDDRNKEVIVLNRAAFEDWPIKGDERIGAMIVRLGIALRGENEPTRLLIGLGVGVGGMIALLMVMVVGRRLWPGAPGWIVPISAIVGTNVVGWAALRLMTKWASGRLAAIVLDEGICACCGYNLYGIPAGKDGCVACPECGSAWKGGRIKRTAPFVAGAKFGSPFREMGRKSRRQSWTTRDANGRRVVLADPRLHKLIKAAQAAGDEEREARLRGVVREIARRSRPLRWTVLALIACAGMGLIWVAVAANGIGLPALCAAMVAVLTVGAGVFGNFLYSERATRDEMANGRVCPSCQHDLMEEEVRETGVVECPECLGVWRLREGVRSGQRGVGNAGEERGGEGGGRLG